MDGMEHTGNTITHAGVGGPLRAAALPAQADAHA